MSRHLCQFCCSNLPILVNNHTALPKKLVNLHPPYNTRQSPPKTLRWNTQLIAVGNRQGFTTYLPYWKKSQIGTTWRYRLKAALQTALEPDNPKLDNFREITLHQPNAPWWKEPPFGATGQFPHVHKGIGAGPCGKSVRKRPADTKQTARSQGIVRLMKKDVAAAGEVPRALRQASRELVASLSPPPTLKFD